MEVEAGETGEMVRETERELEEELDNDIENVQNDIDVEEQNRRTEDVDQPDSSQLEEAV